MHWLSLNIKDFASFKAYILCSCQVVRIVVKKLNEAFQMFESQNGRGKELEAYNLLKAYHIRAMSNDSKASKIEYDKQWESAALYCRDGYKTILQMLKADPVHLVLPTLSDNLIHFRIYSLLTTLDSCLKGTHSQQFFFL